MQGLTKIKKTENQLIGINQEELGVNIFLGFITSTIGLIVIGGVFLEENLIFEKLFDHFALTGLGLQIFPAIFSLISQKNSTLVKFWIAIFWLTILFEFLILTVLMAKSLPV